VRLRAGGDGARVGGRPRWGGLAVRRAVGRNSTVPDLSCEGIQRIVAALAVRGVQVHWDDETDYETYLDLHLRPVHAEVPLTLSWRESTGWVVTEHADPRRDWRIGEADLGEVA